MENLAGTMTAMMTTRDTRLRVLILCTGNSARSQMAEGLVNARLGERFVAYSAGTAPTGHVHPQAIAALAEAGIDIRAQRSKSIAELPTTDFDLVITVCDNAAETCPVWLGQGRRVHIGFPDPAAAPPAQQPAAFRAVRDAIEQKLLGYLRGWPHGD
jgi:arsenate reductase